MEKTGRYEKYNFFGKVELTEDQAKEYMANNRPNDSTSLMAELVDGRWIGVNW